MRPQFFKAQEERRLRINCFHSYFFMYLLSCQTKYDRVLSKEIQERHQRMTHFLEPSDGVPIRFKFPNGLIKTRKFTLSEAIQTLFDFVGQEDSATEMFSIREAGSGIEVSSSLSGSIKDYNVMGFSTLYDLWRAASEDEMTCSSSSPPCTSASLLRGSNSSSPPRRPAPLARRSPSPPRRSAPLPRSSYSPSPPCRSAPLPRSSYSPSPPRTSAPLPGRSPSPPRTSAPLPGRSPSPPCTSAPLPGRSPSPPCTSALSSTVTYQHAQWSLAHLPPGSPDTLGSHFSPSPTSLEETDSTKTELRNILKACQQSGFYNMSHKQSN